MRIFYQILPVARTSWILGVLLMVPVTTCISSECGDFYKKWSGTLADIYSPNYPDHYPEYSKCIWRIGANQGMGINLEITFTGESYNGACSDYIEVRKGSQTAELVGTYCGVYTNEIVYVDSAHVWILFKSDGMNSTGSPMHLAFSGILNSSIPLYPQPWDDCRSYEFECRNMECLSMSYRCDGYNDCGCIKDCDEDECYSLDISKGVQVGISIAVGTFVFIAVCILAYFIEGNKNWIATKSEELQREREAIAEQKRRRASRAFTKFIGVTEDKDLILFSQAKSLQNMNKNKKNAPGTSTMSVTEFEA